MTWKPPCWKPSPLLSPNENLARAEKRSVGCHSSVARPKLKVLAGPREAAGVTAPGALALTPSALLESLVNQPSALEVDRARRALRVSVIGPETTRSPVASRP